MAHRTTDELVTIIIKTLHGVSPSAGPLEASSILLGDGAVLDSVGLVTFLVALEQELNGEVDFSTLFLEHGDTETGNPFHTIGSLAAYVSALDGAHA